MRFAGEPGVHHTPQKAGHRPRHSQCEIHPCGVRPALPHGESRRAPGMGGDCGIRHQSAIILNHRGAPRAAAVERRTRRLHHKGLAVSGQTPVDTTLRHISLMVLNGGNGLWTGQPIDDQPGTRRINGTAGKGLDGDDIEAVEAVIDSTATNKTNELTRARGGWISSFRNSRPSSQVPIRLGYVRMECANVGRRVRAAGLRVPVGRPG